MILDRHEHEQHRKMALEIGAPEFYGVRCTAMPDRINRCGGQDYCTETGRCLKCGRMPKEDCHAVSQG